MLDWNERVHMLDYDSAVAMRYHGRRQRFLNTVARLDPTLSMILGGAVFATALSSHPHLAAACGLASAIVSVVALSFGLSDRVRLHETLFRRWGEIRAELLNLVEDDFSQLRRLEVKRPEIDAQSPWQLVALSVICENEEKMCEEHRRSTT